jgi:hypothetical protein
MAVVLDPADYDITVQDPRIKFHFNVDKMLGTANTLKAVSMLEMNDSDILAFLDGDDWLRADALEMVENKYKGSGVLVTHGSFITSPLKDAYSEVNKPYTREEFKNIRRSKWRGSALRTMKYEVFKRIKDKDLRDDNGAYFIGCDMALMYPALEMVGYDRVGFIGDTIYVYNVSGLRTPHTHGEETRKEYQLIRNRKSYEPLG